MERLDLTIAKLIAFYLSGDIDEQQKKELMAWVEKNGENRRLFEKMCSDINWRKKLEYHNSINVKKAIRDFDRRVGKKPSAFSSWRLWATAAAAVILISLATNLLTHENNPAQPLVSEQIEILPGSSKARLILANGEQVELTGNDSLCLVSGQGVSVVNRGTELVYQGRSEGKEQYNELQISRGGEYRLLLSDGSVVRLNSGSTLRYPVAFGSAKRQVELVGEAYFEVVKDASRPFYVTIGGMTIKVYGTIFNVSSHLPGRIQTVLVEGKVGITVDGKEQEFILKPSCLAELDTRTKSMEISHTDVFPYIAWTNGLFVFNSENLEQIMNTLSLWYDVDVFYQNPELKELHFTGCLKRYDKIDNILNALSQTVGVTFQQKGRTLLLK